MPSEAGRYSTTRACTSLFVRYPTASGIRMPGLAYEPTKLPHSEHRNRPTPSQKRTLPCIYFDQRYSAILTSNETFHVTLQEWRGKVTSWIIYCLPLVINRNRLGMIDASTKATTNRFYISLNTVGLGQLLVNITFPYILDYFTQ